MIWYLVILLIFVLLGIYIYILKALGHDPSKIVFLICCFILLIFAALRSVNVGADTAQYQFIFDWIKTLRLSEIANQYSPIPQWDAEYSYKIYNKLLSFISSNSQTITVMNSVLIIVSIGLLIREQSVDWWLSIFLYLTLGFYQTALNLTPSSISSVIAMIAVPYALKKKPIRYLLLIALARVFHTSAIFFLPLYYIFRYKLAQNQFLTILGIGFVLSRFYSVLQDKLIYLLPTSYQLYLLNDENTGISSQLLVWVVHIILIAVCWFAAWKAKRLKEFIYENNVGLKFFLIESIMYFFALESKMFSRAAFLFSIYIIISIPKMLNYSIKKYPNIKTVNYNIRHMTVKGKAYRSYYFLIVILCLFQYILRLKVNNIGLTIPYDFFF